MMDIIPVNELMQLLIHGTQKTICTTFLILLSDLACRRASCPEGKRQIKLTDSHGLFLLVNNRGGKYWRWNYCFDGRQRTLALGIYPEIALKDARQY